jgi:hypothetical protein
LARFWPFAWGLGLLAGAALAAMIGVFGPSWGVAAAFPVVTLMFAIGAQFEEEDELIAHLVRFCAAAALGFTVITVPINLYYLLHLVAQAPDNIAPEVASRATQLRAQLWPRWGVISLAIPVGTAALALRFVRRGQRPRARTDAA